MRNFGKAVLASVMCFGCGVGELTVDGQDDSAAVDNAIIGGTVDYGHPAVGVILMDKVMFSGAVAMSKCTGTLIGPKLILTAGHCVRPKDGMVTGAKVFFGTDANTAPASAFVSAILWSAHPSYNNQVVEDPFDIGVLVLSSNPSITPMPYNRAAMATSLVGQPLTAVGYGNTANTQTWTKGIKRQVTTKLARIDANGKHFQMGAAGSTICWGDSGGPSFMKVGGVDTVMGVTSYAPIPCESGPGTAVRTDPYLAFINQYLLF